MKKKTILSSSVFVASLLTASAVFAGGPEVVVIPDYFSGFYIGGTVAGHHASLHENSTLTQTEPLTNSIIATRGRTDKPWDPTIFVAPGTIQSVSAKGSSWDTFGGVVGGIGKVWNHRWYLGAVGFGEWGDQSDKASVTTNSNLTVGAITVGGVPAVFSSSGTVTSTTKTRLNNFYGGALKLGWLPYPRTMFYGKVGAAWTDLKVSNTVSGSAVSTLSLLNSTGTAVVGQTTVINTLNGSGSNSDTKVGIFAGVGAEQIVWGDNVSVGVEWDYANFGSVSVGPFALTRTMQTITAPEVGVPGTTSAVTTTPSIVSTSANGRANVSNILASVNYYFDPAGWF